MEINKENLICELKSVIEHYENLLKKVEKALEKTIDPYVLSKMMSNALKTRECLFEAKVKYHRLTSKKSCCKDDANNKCCKESSDKCKCNCK